MIEAVGNFVGGVGVFFVGMHLLKKGLKQTAGRPLRLALGRVINSPLRACFLGLIFGLVSKSRSAITSIAASMVVSGMMSVRQALPVIFWANVGCGGIVLLAFFNLKLAILFTLGISGVSAAFNFPSRLKHIVWSLFGLSLLFFGLEMVKTGAVSITSLHWITDYFSNHSDAYFLAFCLGAGLTALTQSSVGISILAVTMGLSGLLSFGQVLMFIYGTNLGSSFIVWLLSLKTKGRLKQVIMAQIFFNLLGVLIFVPLFYLELFDGPPLIHALLTGPMQAIPKAQQMALAYILFNLTGAILLSLFVRPFANFLERTWPLTREEIWANPRFLHDQTLQDFDSALVLLELEHKRLIKRLPLFTDALRTPDTARQTLEALHQAHGAITTEIDTVVAELMSQEHRTEDSERAVYFQNRHTLFCNLEAAIKDFCTELLIWARHHEGMEITDVFLEGIDLVLHTLIEAANNDDQAEVQILISLTQDKGPALEELRDNYLSRETSISPQGRSALLAITGLYERAVWAANRLGQQMAKDHTA